jgi:tight adherence protein B
LGTSNAAHGTLAAGAASLGARALSWLDGAFAPLRRAGSAGVSPSDRERRRLSAVLGAGSFLVGLAVGGLLAGVVAGLVAAASTSRLLAARRTSYLRRIDAGAARAALVIADGLAGGRSIRGAIEPAGTRLDGPVGVEFARVASDIALGLTTDEALDRLRTRARSRRIDMIVAAIRLQRRAGGDLARLLREIAATAEESARLAEDARAATAQARFTGLLVSGFGPMTVLLAELAAPGTTGRITASASGLVLLAIAALMQLAGAIAIRRISRVRL